MNEAFDSMRPLVSRLAERLATPAGGTILRQLQLLSRAAKSGDKAPASPPLAAISHVGIWQGREGLDGREFVRDRNYFNLWRSCAEVERIPAKTKKKRVVLLGESAARGLFYDPAHTPAQVLQAALDAGGGAYEVVDLAASAITPPLLLGLLRQLPAIQPDAVILFAGNNWHYEFNQDRINPTDAGAIAEALGRGLQAYQAEINQRHLRGIAESILREFARVAKTLGIPGVVVVPEFNLGDWRDDFPPPLLESGSTGEWHDLKAAAEAACAEGRWESVESFARRMGAIDLGLAPQGRWLLSRVALARGLPAEARIHLEAAKDAAGCLPPRATPRCLSVTQAVLRSADKRFGLRIVDLPDVLARDGAIPGRNHFLDYCHLTAAGIAVAMRATADAVAEAVAPGSQRPAAEPAALPEPDPATAAAAHLLAAIHNAILGQPPEIIAHHCRTGLKLDPTADRLLLHYCCSRMSPIPDWLHGDLARACPTLNARRNLNQRIFAPDGRYFPHRLLDSAKSLLPPEWLASCHQGMRRQLLWSQPEGRLDLLDPRFHSAAAGVRASGCLVEKHVRTEFRFFGPPPGEIKIRLCCRTPHAADPAQILQIAIGPTPVWSGPVGAAWKKIEAGFAQREPEGGALTLSLSWPALSGPWTGAWQAARDSIDRGEAPDIYPTFGEVHSLSLEW